MKEKEAAEKGIDVEKLKQEQAKLSKELVLKLPDVDIEKVAGVAVSSAREIIVGIVVMQDDEIIDKKFFIQPARFPYISGFRTYREMPCIIKAYRKLEEEPDLIFINAHGLAHQRFFGLACHLGLSIQKPVIGVANSLLAGKVKGGKIIVGSKIVGAELHVKEGSNPIFISPGNLVSVNEVVKLTKKFILPPHKLPESLKQAERYVKKVRRELVE